MTSLGHEDRLLLYCRLCGRRSIPECSARVLRPVSLVAGVVRALHGDDEAGSLGQERKDVYPKHVCQACALKLSKKDKVRSIFICFFSVCLIIAHPHPSQDGDDLTDKIGGASRGRDAAGLAKLARELPLSEYYPHGAMGGGCQVCDEDDFYGGEAVTSERVRRVRRWPAADRLVGEGPVELDLRGSGAPVLVFFARESPAG